jgi:aquaporin Z
MKKYIYEFIGTFFLVLTVGLTVIMPGSGPFAPIAIGAVLAVMVYATAHVSGGHLNPAVSLAVFMRGKLSQKDLFKYWVAQFVAGFIAAFFVCYFKGGMTPVALKLDAFKALIAEFLFSYALCYVVLNVATVKETKGNSFFGWAIGFMVLVGAYAVGVVSAGAFNPAVAFGISLMGLSAWTNLWIYLVANFAGGAVAAVTFKFAHPKE